MYLPHILHFLAALGALKASIPCFLLMFCFSIGVHAFCCLRPSMFNMLLVFSSWSKMIYFLHKKLSVRRVAICPVFVSLIFIPTKS